MTRNVLREAVGWLDLAVMIALAGFFIAGFGTLIVGLVLYVF